MKPSQQRQKLLKARKGRLEGHTGGGSHKNLSYKRNSQLQVLRASAGSSEDNIRQGQSVSTNRDTSCKSLQAQPVAKIIQNGPVKGEVK